MGIEVREHLVTWGNRVERNCAFVWIRYCPWQWILKFKIKNHGSCVFGLSFLALHFLGVKENENLIIYLVYNSVFKFEDRSINIFNINFKNHSFFKLFSYLNIIIIWFKKKYCMLFLLFGRSSWYLLLSRYQTF